MRSVLAFSVCVLAGLVGASQAIAVTLPATDMMLHEAAIQQSVMTGKRVSWKNKQTGNRGAVQSHAIKHSTENCRSVQSVLFLKDGRTQLEKSSACMGDAGKWSYKAD